MAYNINKSNSDPVTIPAEVIDNQFDIPLVGQDAKNWGDDIALAFVRLLENFANSSAPAFGNARTPGQLWYDTGTSTLRVYNGTTWDALPTGLETSTVALAADQVGKQTKYIPTSVMYAQTTAGAASATVELVANQPMINVFDFDQTTQEAVQFEVALPKEWDEGTITYQVFWTSADTNGTNVIWGLQGVSVADDGAIATAFGTAVTVTDTDKVTANDLNVSIESDPVTITGAAVDTLTYFRIYRDAAAGGDTLAADARLLGIKLFYTTNAPTSD